ncbi:GxxExxY protein [Sunxiuqinia dokdonensis]|uniref:Uncharacterized protein n=1 Tax=Sunxiuqinia dokdonensis TaxID=1409788 RepID=A0A0L8VF30_9BACT|nr:GxxExxY protein [Sunxiuqinia dokdonensis]KOH46963.1 hypothetical protein NC99_02020 [Sunxiuqinia dokdonensis]
MELIYAEEAYKIQGAAFEVYKEIGCGFLESNWHGIGPVDQLWVPSQGGN